MRLIWLHGEPGISDRRLLETVPAQELSTPEATPPPDFCYCRLERLYMLAYRRDSLVFALDSVIFTVASGGTRCHRILTMKTIAGAKAA